MAKNRIIEIAPISAVQACAFNEQNHSRLPHVQRGPWKYIFGCYSNELLVGVAFWHNTSARGLPHDWLELRRMALSPDAPRFSASSMLGKMAKWFRVNSRQTTRLISYHDVSVHTGTIYKAAGWTPTHVSRPRNRDRSGLRKGTGRRYRHDANGSAPAASAKIRWELALNGENLSALSDQQIEAASALKPTK